MDNNSDNNWVEERLAALRPDSEWQPDAVRGLARFHAQREQKSKRVRRWSRLAAGVLAAGLPVMALPSTREFAHRCVSACVSQSNWAVALFRGYLSPSAPSTLYVKEGDRKMAPDFTLNDASGKAVKLSEFRGQVVLLNFWATWCTPCTVEMPWFVEFQQAHQNDGFATLGVSLDENGWDSVRPYLDEHKVNYRVMVGNDDLAQVYGATVLPTTFIIDKSGRIAATHAGLCSRSEYEADIKAVLNEK